MSGTESGIDNTVLPARRTTLTKVSANRSRSSGPILTRQQFREQVLARDQYRCVICGAHGPEVKLDAHHVLNRALWADDGNYLSNGVALCARGSLADAEAGRFNDLGCHLKAELTLIDPETLRAATGITEPEIPAQFTADDVVDTFGNPVLPDGTRTPGELFSEPAVQKVLRAAGVLDRFNTTLIRYPRTFHHPLSPGAGDDDSYITDLAAFAGQEVVVTAKLDGENATLSSDHVTARSLDSSYHPSRTRVRALWARIRHEIPDGFRVCGENMQATHAIAYRNLPGPLIVFAIYDDRNVCLSWEQTGEWAGLLDLPTAPVLYQGQYDEESILALTGTPPKDWADESEGLVCRRVDEISYRQWRNRAWKWVRAGHVADGAGHWMSRTDISENTFTVAGG
jgi:hypothetical protein